jgi:hypothetical protein
LELSRQPIPPEAPPEESIGTVKVLNMLRTCPYVSLEFAIEFYQIKDVEQLILELKEIGSFSHGVQK